MDSKRAIGVSMNGIKSRFLRSEQIVAVGTGYVLPCTNIVEIVGSIFVGNLPLVVYITGLEGGMVSRVSSSIADNTTAISLYASNTNVVLVNSAVVAPVTFVVGAVNGIELFSAQICQISHLATKLISLCPRSRYHQASES